MHTEYSYAERSRVSERLSFGELKREELVRYESDVAIDLMRRLKRTLDPKGIMNPGKVVQRN